jgi:hypothetical protein
LIDRLEMLDVAELSFRLEPVVWAFAEARAAEIAAGWESAVREKPALYNGRVLLLAQRTLETRSDGSRRMSGAFFETDYAAFVAWKSLGFPGTPVENAFSMAALRSADGAFLMGEMAPHTYNAGQIYFPAGTPDPSDVFDGRVDLDASARRELKEETGLDASETSVAPGWTVIVAPGRVAAMKAMTLALSAEEAKSKIESLLPQGEHAEFSRIHIVRKASDIDERRTPAFVAAYIRANLRPV